MPRSRTKKPGSVAAGPITLSEGSITIRDVAAFGLDGDEATLRFLSRAFSISDVRSVTVDREGQTARLFHGADREDLAALLSRLVGAIRGTSGAASPVPLPALTRASKFSIHRHGSTLTTWEVVADEPGRLKLRQDSLRGDAVIAARIGRELLGIPGVRVVKSNERTGHLLVRFDPALVSSRALLGRAESTLQEIQLGSSALPKGILDRFSTANLTLGVAAAGEFLIPALLPVSALLLVATNARTFRSALRLVRERKLGLPVLYIAIVATTLATGQFLASALMTWLFRFWDRTFRVELASERCRLLEGTRMEAETARLLVPSGAEVLVTVGRLKVCDLLIVAKGERVPADGLILAGEGVVDERLVRGLEGISTRRAGETILAGSTVLAGSFQLEVTQLGDRTRASLIRKTLVAATSPDPGLSAPTARSEKFATRAVGPTLATAGVGLLAGDLMTVGAILRPDYATGPGLAVPLETLHKVALCARSGIVIRDPEALERLAEIELFVVHDHQALRAVGLEVTKIETKLPEPLLLRYAASAFRHLVDDRGRALLDACRDRRAHVLDLEAVEFGRGVTVQHDKHRIRVGESDPAAGPSGPLVVEIDGIVVGLIEFGPARAPLAASTVGRIRRESHVPFALVSPASSAEVSAMAGTLGVEMFRGDFSAGEVADFLAACRNRGLKAAFVGDCRHHALAASHAHVAISMADHADFDLDPAPLLIQRPHLDPLGDLFRIARDHASRVEQAQKLILVPNLICIAGAFLFGFTGMTVVMLSNLGTLGLYRIASESLRGLDAPDRGLAGRPRRAG